MKKTHNDTKKRLVIIVILFLLFSFVAKLLYLYFLPLPLSYDEAYYWDWSRFLDFGYYNKPPMVAWIIRAFTEVFGNTEFAVRLPALICVTLTIFLSFFLVWKYFSEVNATWLLLNLFFIPILTVYSFIMTIDPPLILFWILSLLFFLNYLKKPCYKNAIFAGIFVGLGLLTKQTMFAFVFLSGIYLLLFNRNLLFKKETFFLFLTAFLIYFPNLYWNYNHQFVLLKHTEEHFTRKTLSIYSFLKFLGDSIGVYTPLFLFFLYSGIAYTRKFFKNQYSEALKFLYFLSFPSILSLLFLSFFIELNANWILPFVLTGFLFLFGYISLSSGWRVFLFGNLVIAIILSVMVYLLGYFPQRFPEPLQVLLEKFRGWKILAERVERYYNQNIPLVTENRAIAATLAFYVKSHPKVYVIQFKKYPENQYHLWRNADSLTGKRVLVVKKRLKKPYYLENLEKIGEIEAKVTSKRHRYFSIWEGTLNL